MASKVIFTVEGKGKNLKKTSKEVNDLGRGAERAGKGLDGAGKAQDRYHRGAKGAAGATSNSTKAFSKMQQTIGGGSSGLVGAYATLAANLFAASAAFNALQKAAQLEGVVKALEDVGAAAGRNLGAAADRLREVSGQAISADQSLRAMSLGVSSGFSTDQMEGLTKVARGASVALGRDLGDALDRLTRGTAKLEPEILDELGIMVRLDDATAEYAATIGKSVNDLSQYERRQAFLNATLEQGTKKFGELAETIEVNPYDKLAATLGDTAKQFLTLINNGVRPFVTILAENQGVLIGTIVMFASTIAKQLLPAMTTLGTKTVQQSQMDAKASAERLKLLNTSNSMPKAYITAAQAMSKGTITQEQYDKALRSTAASINRHEAGLQKMTLSNEQATKSFARKTLVLRQVKKAREELIRTAMLHATVQAKENAGNAIQMIGQGSLIKGFTALGRSVSLFATQTIGATAAGNGLTRTMGFMRIGAFALGTSLRAVGSAFMAMLGPIGLVVSIGMMLYDTFKDKFVQADPVKDEVDKIVKELEYLDEVGRKFADNMDKSGAGSADNVVAGYKALGGVLQELQSNLNRVQRAHVQTKSTAIDAANAEIEAQQLIVEANENKAHENARNQTTAAGRAYNAAKAAIEEQKELIKTAEAEMESLAPEQLLKVIDETNSKLLQTGAFGKFSEVGVKAIADVRKEVKAQGGSIEEVNRRLEEAIRPIMNMAGAFDTANDAASQFRKEQTKLATKATTPFDGVIDGAKGMLKSLEVVNAAINNLSEGATDSEKGKLENERKVLLAEINKQMGSEFLTGSDNLEEYVNSLLTARNTLLQSKGAIKNLQKEQKDLNRLDKSQTTLGTLNAVLAKEKQLRDERKAAAEASIALTELSLGKANEELITEAEKAVAQAQNATDKKAAQNELDRLIEKSEQARLSNLDAQQKLNRELFEEKVANATKEFRLTQRQAEVSIQENKRAQELLALTKERTTQIGSLIEAQMESVRLNKAGATGDESATKGEELVLFQAVAEARKASIDEEHNLKVEMIQLEFELLEAKQKLFQAEVAIKLEEGKISEGAATAAIEASKKTVTHAEKIAKLSKQNAERQRRLDQLSLANEGKKLALQAAEERRQVGQDAGSPAEAAGLIAQYDRDVAAARDAAIKAQITEKDAIIKAFATENSVMISDGVYQFTKGQFEQLHEQIKSALGESMANASGTPGAGGTTDVATGSGAGTGVGGDGTGDTDPLVQMKDRLALTQAVLSPMVDKFKEMGPEGEVVAAVTGGALAISDAFTTMSVNVENGANKTAAGLEMASAVIGQVANIAAAGSKAKIAGIDKEISAEKKRDGKSKESQARIRALEAKKEKEKKKAFEMNKKMQMATIIIDTAAAAMKVVGQTGIFGLSMVPMVIAMGAAQLAMVASQSYQGGGGSMGGGSSAPAKVTMGSRQNKVDVATGPSRAAGELSYMRGERGQGTSASTFTPAFGGIKYRAAGGAAYMIGEQGPEVFVPEVPGRIMPNDEVRQGAGGTPVNATFNINAIDASNLEQTLTAQRGNIIGMIREAANSSGESFLENVDTLALGEDRNTY